MYLTQGQYKRTKIELKESIKPTLSKVRESVFNILMQFNFEDNSFLDMFAGSGLMGLEALSRGYKVKEIEINPKHADIIKKNYAKIKQKPDIVVANALNFKTDEKFSIIYLDPPWDMDYAPVIKKAFELLKDDGVIFVEHDKTKKLDIEDILTSNQIPLKIFKSKKYGRCLIEVLVK